VNILSLTNLKSQIVYFRIHFVFGLLCDGGVNRSSRDGIGREIQMVWYVHNMSHSTVLKTLYIFLTAKLCNGVATVSRIHKTDQPNFFFNLRVFIKEQPQQEE